MAQQKGQNIFEALLHEEVTPRLAEGWQLAAHYKWILNASAIHYATYWHPESLVYLLKIKPELMNRPTGLIKTSNEPNHFTPLHVASTLESKAIPTSILINKRANVEAKDFEDKTPLHIAAKNGCTYKVMALLYDGNANVVPLDKQRETPLHQAKNSKIVDLLLTKATTKQILEIEENNTETSLFDKILVNHPSSLNKYLDKMVTSNDTEADVHDQHLTFNLSMFNSIKNEKQNYLDKHIALIKKGSQQLLTHPLMRLFISLKWQPHKIRYQINFFIFLVFVLIFTIHGAICIDFLQCEDGKEGELVKEKKTTKKLFTHTLFLGQMWKLNGTTKLVNKGELWKPYDIWTLNAAYDNETYYIENISNGRVLAIHDTDNSIISVRKSNTTGNEVWNKGLENDTKGFFTLIHPHSVEVLTATYDNKLIIAKGIYAQGIFSFNTFCINICRLTLQSSLSIDLKTNENDCKKEVVVPYHITKWICWGLVSVLAVMEMLQFLSKVIDKEVGEYFTRQNMIEAIMLIVTIAFFVIQFIEGSTSFQSEKSGAQEHLLG